MVAPTEEEERTNQPPRLTNQIIPLAATNIQAGSIHLSLSLSLSCHAWLWYHHTHYNCQPLQKNKKKSVCFADLLLLHSLAFSSVQSDLMPRSRVHPSSNRKPLLIPKVQITLHRITWTVTSAKTCRTMQTSHPTRFPHNSHTSCTFTPCITASPFIFSVHYTQDHHSNQQHPTELHPTKSNYYKQCHSVERGSTLIPHSMNSSGTWSRCLTFQELALSPAWACTSRC